MRRAFLALAVLMSAAALLPTSAQVADRPDWLLASASASPPSRNAHAMAYDSARGRVVLFAGANENHYIDFGDTWEWDGTSWIERRPSVSPIPRFGHAMAYDAARGRVVLFGGYDFFSGVLLSDTWEWDGNAWLEMAPTSLVPPERFGHAMAYDSSRQRIVLFGGSGVESDLADTWEWDGSNWTERTPEAGPPAREYGSIAYDSARGRIVLFGGVAGSTYFGDTWEWDGALWVERTPVTSPPGRTWQSLAYDDARGRTVLFGGYDGTTAFGDTWEWDGNAWTETTPAASPSPRVVSAMVFDRARGRATLFAGYDGRAPLGDTWEWDGTGWVEKTPATGPPARSNHAAAYDDARHRTVVFGGYGGGPFLADTWEWDGSRWSNKTPAISPPSRIYPGMAYDSGRGKMVLFGGYGQRGPVADTWEWDGTSWVQKTTATAPSPRHSHTMVYDAARGRVVLFGGSNGIDWFNDTWEWDGNNWVEVTPATSPSPRYRYGMTYDAARQRVVLFGGADDTYVFNDTWEWDGTSWELKTPETKPPERWGHAMAYDAERGRSVVFGGSNGTALIGDTWEWDGNDWTEYVPWTTPTPVFHYTLTYDGVSRRVLLFGGFNGTYLGNTWTYGPISVCGHADRVVAFAPGGGNASESAEAALGPPDEVTVTSGVGGRVDLGLSRAAQNGEGIDLIVHAITDQSYRVEAGADGANFVFLRDCLGGECQLDLGEAGLSTVSYLRITALSPDTGIDLDAVSVIHQPPAALTCPASVAVECQAAGSAVISIPPATADDSCSSSGGIVNDHNGGGADASGSYPLGETTVTFSADDGAGGVATCSMSITVADNTPPVVTVIAGPADLRPADHTMRPVHFTVVAVDACDPSPVVILQSVTSSEPDDLPSQWDGGTTGDVQGAAAGTADLDVFLRAERDGRGSGRTYSASYRATDASGNEGSGVAQVRVDRDLRRPPPPFARNGRK